MSERFVCPPPDTGLQSIAYRVEALVELDVTLSGLTVVDLVTVGLLMVTVRTGTPTKLRACYRWAVAAAVAAPVPFVGAVLAMAHYAFLELAHDAWRPEVFDAHLARHVVCGYIILLLGAGAALAPALVAALGMRRFQLLTGQRDLEASQLRRWAALGAAPVALQLAWAVIWLLTDELTYELYGLVLRTQDEWLEGLVALGIVLATSLAAVATVALPFGAAARASRPSKPPSYALTDPTRFFVSEQP